MGCMFPKNQCDQCCRRIGCSCREHEDEPLTGITENRSCTDIPFILAFGIFAGVMIFYVWVVCYSQGDINRITRGVNYNELICGKDDLVELLPYAFWPDPSDYSFKVCTDDCNAATSTNAAANHIHIAGIASSYESELFIDRYCVPTSGSDVHIHGFDSWSTSVTQSMADCQTAMWMIAVSIIFSIIVSFGYIWMMKCCVGCLVWTSIVVIIVGSVLLGAALISSKDQDGLSDNEKDFRLWGGVSFFIFAGIFTCIIIFVRNRIRIAIEVIKSAGRSIQDMPMVIFFPILPGLIMIGFFFTWVYAGIYMFSAGGYEDETTPSTLIGQSWDAGAGAQGDAAGTTFKSLDHTGTIENSFVPHFFLLLWTMQIGIYFTFAVIAGAVADWYFTRRDDNGDKRRGSEDGELSKGPISQSCCRTSRYHFGTIIYAALIIAIVEFIRWVMRYCESKLVNSGKNKVGQVLLKCADCCLAILECCLNKVNKNALIWMAVYGDAFCPSVCGSFKIIWSNLLRMAVITFFTTIVTTLGKIMIPLFTTGFFALILTHVSHYSDNMGSPALPLVIIFILSLCIAVLFLEVYDVAIDTVFICFLIDERQNKANNQMFADEGIEAIIQRYDAESKALAAKMTTRSDRNEFQGAKEIKKRQELENAEREKANADVQEVNLSDDV